mgnify:CR=1 FL=1
MHFSLEGKQFQYSPPAHLQMHFSVAIAPFEGQYSYYICRCYYTENLHIESMDTLDIKAGFFQSLSHPPRFRIIVLCSPKQIREVSID